MFDHYPNFGIGDVVAGTTPVTLIKHTLAHHKGFHLPTLTDEFVFHQLAMGNKNGRGKKKKKSDLQWCLNKKGREKKKKKL